ncbi:MAG: hypothetical protein KC656_38125, partial [Myxococcales bacterium]|nr:hypothetical protein [Myxococcales bacterium]
MLFWFACTVAPPSPLFTPRADLAGRIATPFGDLRSAGIQQLCRAPEVRVGTVLHVAEPVLRPSGLRTQRLTL